MPGSGLSVVEDPLQDNEVDPAVVESADLALHADPLVAVSLVEPQAALVIGEDFGDGVVDLVIAAVAFDSGLQSVGDPGPDGLFGEIDRGFAGVAEAVAVAEPSCRGPAEHSGVGFGDVPAVGGGAAEQRVDRFGGPVDAVERRASEIDVAVVDVGDRGGVAGVRGADRRGRDSVSGPDRMRGGLVHGVRRRSSCQASFRVSGVVPGASRIVSQSQMIASRIDSAWVSSGSPS